MKAVKLRLNEKQQGWVRDWWRALQPRQQGDEPLLGELGGLGRGARAQLARCCTVQELLSQHAAILFASRLIELGGENPYPADEGISYEHLVRVAACLALVRNDDHQGGSLARQLGHAAAKARPPMSELRFRAMQRCAVPDDLLVHWRRAIHLADRKADVVRLADDLLRWQREQGQVLRRASSSVKFQWAHDYYLSSRDQAAAADNESLKENLA